MKTLTNILIVLVLTAMAFLCWQQEQDIISLRHRAYQAEGGLQSLYGGLVSAYDELDQLKGGLDQLKGGSGLEYLKSASAIVWVISDQGSLIHGTGVFVSDNILLTAKHVVEDRLDLSGVTLVGPDGVVHVAVEILEDIDDDLALVIVEGREGPHLELGSRPALGDRLICIGTPFREQAQLIITWGRVSSENWKNTFIYDGFCWYGCSGGPIISADGRLIGVVNARLNASASLGFAAPTERLDADLLDLILYNN